MNSLPIDKTNNIRQKLEISPGVYIVLIDVSGRKDIPIQESNDNVYCVDESNDILWTVKDKESISDKRDSFVALTYKNGALQARRFFGREYEIDIDSGEAKQIGWNK